VFGMSAGEIGVILIVGLVVVGPKRLPELMRSLGKWVSKLRRLSTTLRDQSGIDRILREEGLDKEIKELRALRESLSKSAVLESLMQAANKPASSPRPPAKAISGKPPEAALGAAKTPNPGPPGASTPPLVPSGAVLPEKKLGEIAKEVALTGTTQSSEPAQTSSEITVENKVAVGSDGSSTTSDALSLIQPAAGSIPRAPKPATPLPVVFGPVPSFREREYPAFGPDHYEAFPDDLADDDPPIEPGMIGATAGASENQTEETAQ